jgi:glucokinase
MLLAGDIGGTKTSLAIISPEVGARAPLAEGTFPSAKYAGLEEPVQEFLADARTRVDGDLIIKRATFGVAGPVVNGKAQITNLPWVLDEERLRQVLGVASVRLLNDLEAIAHAIPFLESPDLASLNQGTAMPGGTIAVIAPGTGLGEAFLTWDGTRYRSYASEGGHADFAPSNPSEIGLLQYLRERFGHVSWERVCSGKGIPNIYSYLKESGYADEPAWLAQRLRAAPDPSPIIVNAALAGEHGAELCVSTLNIFLSILGAEAGNLALKVLSTGGVYLGGGIPPRILSALKGDRFIQAFRHKGRFEDFLIDIPVHVILNPEVALFGAVCHGLEAVAG